MEISSSLQVGVFKSLLCTLNIYQIAITKAHNQNFVLMSAEHTEQSQ